MRDLLRPRRMWRRPSGLKDAYDVVIIGGGSHGLAAAYYLAQRGITDVAVLEKSYIGSGAAGRNTTILRSNYKTPEGARFYDASVKLYEGLSGRLHFNLLFSQCGHLTLAHSDRALSVMANRAEVNRLQGIDSRLVGPDEVQALCPAMRVDDDMVHPIMGALYHPPGGIIRHDAVVWGFAREADRAGVEIHPTPRCSTCAVAAGASSRCRRAAARSAPGRCSAARPGGARCCARWPACACRSPPTCCRRASPSRSSRCSTSWSSPRRCTSTSPSPTGGL